MFPSGRPLNTYIDILPSEFAKDNSDRMEQISKRLSTLPKFEGGEAEQQSMYNSSDEDGRETLAATTRKRKFKRKHGPNWSKRVTFNSVGNLDDLNDAVDNVALD